MWQDYWRKHGAYLIGGGAAHIAGWGGVWLGEATRVEFFGGLGCLMLLVSTAVLLWHAFKPILTAFLVVLAVLTIAGVLLAALSELLHPAVLAVLGVAVAALGVVLAGAWWGDHGDAVLDRLEAWWRTPRTRRFSIWPWPARTPRLQLPGAQTPGVTLLLRPIERPIPMRAGPRRNRRCRACGGWIPATAASCPSDDCPSNLDPEA